MKCYIENYGAKAFDCVVGATYKDNFNEDLDSFSLIVTQLSEKLDLEPLQHFRVDYENENISFNSHFVLDSFSETFFNKNNVVYYQYEINLISEIKRLEYVLLPNRTILHSLIDGHKKLYEVIKEICLLYIPKIKKTTDNATWFYDYEIAIPDFSSDEKFDIDCPDLSFDEPSLRDVLNALFYVVGTIPIIRDGVFSYIDLRKEATTFETPTDCVVKAIRSNSSDSYANTLINPIENVLDRNQIVRNEIIGFRDDNDVFLKHAENLVLTTDYPIESVESLKINAYKYMTAQLPAYSSNVSYNKTNGSSFTNQIEFTNMDLMGVQRISFYYAGYEENVVSGTGGLYQYYSLPVRHIRNILSPSVDRSGTNPVVNFSIDDTFSFVVVYYTVRENGAYVAKVSNSAVTRTFAQSTRLVVEKFKGAFQVDLTDMVLEHEERLTTSKKYEPSDIPTPIISANDIDFSTLENCYYETLEYTYQGNEIRGFSNHWEWLNIFLTQEATLVDQIKEWVGQAYTYTPTSADIQTFIQEARQQFMLDEITDDTIGDFALTDSGVRLNALPTEMFDNISPYAQYTFEIRYVPFNRLVASHTKDIADLPKVYSKLDKQESSIIMFDSFSAREQEKINRIGNPICKIITPQIEIGGLINELNTDFDGSIVFSREISFFSSFCEVNYTATKDYVLKNYFTALENKYRAYEYSSVSKTLTRDELIKTFVAVSFGNIEIRNATDLIGSNDWTFLCGGLVRSDKYKLTYTIIGKYANDTNKTDSYKYDVAVVTGSKSIFISHTEKYASMFGNYIESAKYYETNDPLGGYIQSWYPHRESGESDLYNFAHRLGFTNRTFLNQEIEGYENIIASLSFPKIDLWESDYANNFVFYLKDQTNQENGINRFYYKSEGEKISETVQFEYYSTDDIVSFGENLLEYSPLKQNYEDTANLYLYIIDNESAKLEIIDGARTPTSSETLHSLENTPTITNFVGGCKFSVSTNYVYRDMKLALYNSSTNEIIDLVRIYRPTGTLGNNVILNFSVNDTKSTKIYEYNETSGLYEPTANVALATDTRNIEN